MSEKNAASGVQGGPNVPGPQTPAQAPVAQPAQPDPPQPTTPEREEPEQKELPADAHEDLPQNHYGNAAPQDPPPPHRK